MRNWWVGAAPARARRPAGHPQRGLMRGRNWVGVVGELGEMGGGGMWYGCSISSQDLSTLSLDTIFSTCTRSLSPHIINSACSWQPLSHQRQSVDQISGFHKDAGEVEHWQCRRRRSRISIGGCGCRPVFVRDAEGCGCQPEIGRGCPVWATCKSSAASQSDCCGDGEAPHDGAYR